MSMIEGIGVLVMSAGIAVAMGAWLHEYVPCSGAAPCRCTYRRVVWGCRLGGPLVAALGAVVAMRGGA